MREYAALNGALHNIEKKKKKLTVNFDWNDVGDTTSAAAAGNRFHSGIVRATNDPWSYVVTAPMARNLK